MFNRLVWQRDRMLLDDLVFRLEHYRSADWNGGDHFRFYNMQTSFLAAQTSAPSE